MGIRTHTIAIVALVLGVVLFSALLVPVVTNSTSTTEIRQNDSTGGANYFETGNTAVVSDGTSITVDGNALSSRTLLIIGQNFVFRSDGLKWYHDRALTTTVIESGQPWSFTVADSKATFVYAGTTTEIPVRASEVIHAVDSGSYISVQSAAAAETKYVNANSLIFFISGTALNNNWISFGADTPKDYVKVERVDNTGSRYNMVELTVNDTDMAGVYNLGLPTGYFMVIPVEYQAPATATGTVYTILNVLPIIALLGIVMAAAYFAANRD